MSSALLVPPLSLSALFKFLVTPLLLIALTIGLVLKVLQHLARSEFLVPPIFLKVLTIARTPVFLVTLPLLKR